MTGFYLIGGMVVFFCIFLPIVYRLEKRMPWPYGELEPAPHFGDPSGEAAKRVEEAVRGGFVFLGWGHDTKGPKYRVDYPMLVSEERDIFAVIGVGSILNFKLAGTWLYTPSADGRCFYSTNNQAGVQLDVSHHWVNQLVPNASFADLLRKHRDWIREMGVLPRGVGRGREFQEYRDLRIAHFREMERAGLIRYADVSLTHFYFTMWGAVRTALGGYFIGLARGVTNARFPRSA
jgi:hypothetical protein